MEIKIDGFDGGAGFDFGRTSDDYARYRDIYPEEFYQKIAARGLCVKGQRVLDLGTGTGVLPRNMYHYGAEWVGTDISENQIDAAKALAEQAGMNITFFAQSAEDIDYPDNSFDVVTACQCIWYFDHERLMPKLAKLLRPDGRLLLLYMAWLPGEDAIAAASEEVVLRFNPGWTGCGEARHPMFVPDCAEKYFDIVHKEMYDLQVPFTRESWHGRMRTCRGVGASLSPEALAGWEREHMAMLERTAPESFTVQHYAASAELCVRKEK